MSHDPAHNHEPETAYVPVEETPILTNEEQTLLFSFAMTFMGEIIHSHNPRPQAKIMVIAFDKWLGEHQRQAMQFDARVTAHAKTIPPERKANAERLQASLEEMEQVEKLARLSKRASTQAGGSGGNYL